MNKLILPILLIMSVLVVSGCTQGGETKTSPTGQPSNLSTSSSQQTETQSPQQIKSTTETVKKVIEISPATQKALGECSYKYANFETDASYECFKKIAENEGPEVCAITSKFIQGTCFNAFAEIKNDVSICGFSDSLDTSCYLYFLKKDPDPNICEKINLDNPRDVCYLVLASINQDPGMCEKTTYADVSDACYKNMAKLKQDPNLCEKLNTINKRNNCYSDIAIAIKDPTICENIKEEGYSKFVCVDLSKHSE